MKNIVHYPHHNPEKYSAIKQVSLVNEERIRLAKIERERERTNENYHRDQCESIPETIDHSIHGLHLEPCYKQFTLLLSKTKQQSPLPDKRSSTRLTSPSSKSTVCPKECNICNKYTIKIKGNRVVPVTISTMIATETVKAAAMKKNYDLYCEIKDLDLISKEFKYHRSCYKEFTRGFSEKSRSSTSCLDIASTSSSSLEPGMLTNIKAVEEYIENNVVGDHKAVSMLT